MAEMSFMEPLAAPIVVFFELLLVILEVDGADAEAFSLVSASVN